MSRPPEGEYSRLLTTLEAMGRRGVTVHDCETGEVKTSLESIMIAFFKGLAASKERQDIVERSLRGRLAKAKAGKWVGQGWTPYGYRKVGLKHESSLEINEREALIIRRIFRMFIGRDDHPMALKNIARLLTQEGIPTPGRGGHGKGLCWNMDHIRERILKRQAYIGQFEFAGVDIELPHLAIVDQETWNSAQARLEENKRLPRRKVPGINYLMSGHIKCKCGASCTGFHVKNQSRIHRYYRCTAKTRYGRHVCDERNLNASMVDHAAWEWFVGIISSDTRLDKVIQEMKEQAELDLEPTKLDLEGINELLTKTEQKVERLMSAFGDEDNPVVAEALKNQIGQTVKLVESLQQERESLKARINNARISPAATDEIKAVVRQVRARLKDGGTAEDKRLLVEALHFQGKVIYEGNTRKLRLSCGLGRDVKDICLENHSRTRPV